MRIHGAMTARPSRWRSLIWLPVVLAVICTVPAERGEQATAPAPQANEAVVAKAAAAHQAATVDTAAAGPARAARQAAPERHGQYAGLAALRLLLFYGAGARPFGLFH